MLAQSDQALVEREIRATLNTIQSGLSNRRAHPTYGYTKTALKGHLARLEGMLGLYGLLLGLQNHAALATPAAEKLGIDLRDLNEKISHS